jgi:rhodanese-related sulfurtransferase
VRTADDLLAEARSGLRRLDPHETAAAQAAGALVVDIRPTEQRRREGTIPGALVVERNVLEWRLDPTGGHRLPEVTSHNQVVVVICSEGYTSSLAASVLQDMGFAAATDLEGGFVAWAAAGLPTGRLSPRRGRPAARA